MSTRQGARPDICLKLSVKSMATDLCPAGCPARAGDVGLGQSGGLGASQSCKRWDLSLVITFIKSAGTWSLFLGQVD